MRFLCFLLPVILFCAILSHSLYNLDSEQKFCMILYFFLLRLFTFYFIRLQFYFYSFIISLVGQEVINSIPRFQVLETVFPSASHILLFLSVQERFHLFIRIYVKCVTFSMSFTDCYLLRGPLCLHCLLKDLGAGSRT